MWEQNYWANYNNKLIFYRQQMRLQIRVVGLSNSRKMMIDEEGIDLSNWKEELDDGETADSQKFIDEIINKKSSKFCFC